MNGDRMSIDERPLAHAFAEHLTARSSAAAMVLADHLAAAGEAARSELLRAFGQHGDRAVEAGWWAPGTRCHLSLGLPEDVRAGDLWFDPLEVSIALVEPWLRDPVYPLAPDTPEFYGWVPIDAVTSWQLRGAHYVAEGIPQSGESITAEEADRYCNLFSKSLAGSRDWIFLREAYGMEVVTRMWGDPDADQFGSGGAVSGSIEWINLSELRQWPPHDDYEPREGSDLFEAGLAFRGSASYRIGLWAGHGALPRTWTR